MICHESQSVLNGYKQRRDSTNVWQLANRCRQNDRCCNDRWQMTSVSTFSLYYWKIGAKAVMDIWARGSKFKAHYQAKVECLNCAHCRNRMFLVRAAAVRIKSKKKKYAHQVAPLVKCALLQFRGRLQILVFVLHRTSLDQHQTS